MSAWRRCKLTGRTETFSNICDASCDALEIALNGTRYTVNRSPQLCGLWGRNCHTISHPSILLGTPALQLEIPRSLRYDLSRDEVLFDRFAQALATAYRIVVVGNPSQPQPSSLTVSVPATRASAERQHEEEA